ncbi:MAG: TolC family protein [Acidobacteria bacterium]|nr:TolC family protein [Acidobacteriota bacterium]
MRRASVYLALTIFLGVGAAGATAEDQAEVTLAEAVRLALDRHPDVEKARAAADAFKGKVREVKAQAYPEIKIVSAANRVRDPAFLNSPSLDKFPPELLGVLEVVGANLFDYSINVKQTLYSAGKVKTGLKIASVEAEGALADIDRAEQDLAMAVVRAFYDLIWSERYRDQVAETQQQKIRHLEQARVLYRNGAATEVDVLRSEVNVANGQPDLVRAENSIRQARALLNFYLVRSIDFPTRASGEFQEKPWTEGDLDTLMKEAQRRRPELQRLRIAERSAGLQLSLAHAESRLKLDFNGAYGIASRLPSNLASDRFTRWSTGVTMTLPVFDGFKRSGLVWQATAASRQARLERERTEQQVRLALQQGLDELTAATETIAAARANISQAERVLAMMQNNYKYGAATTLDIVDAQTALSVARTNLLRGLHDYSVTHANLRWTAGLRPWE